MSKIKRKYIENYFYGIEELNMSGDLTITRPNEYGKYYLNPNGSNRIVSFSGSNFTKGDSYIVHNIGSGGHTLNVSNASIFINNSERYEVVYNGSEWKAYQLIDPLSNDVTLFHHVFQYEGSARTRWLSHEGDTSIPSNNTRAIIPWNCTLFGVSYSNQYNNRDVDIEVYKNGTASSDKVFTLEVRNLRWKYKTNISGVNFLPGDRISCRTRDRGDNSNDPVVHLFYKIMNFSTNEVGGNT